MKTRVLVVDDDRLVADTLSLIFNANGYECEARYSAADGLDRVHSFAPNLVLCDLTLPGENGFQLATHVHACQPDTRLLLLTGHHQIDIDALVPGILGDLPLKVLRKPCRPDDLLRETRALLTPLPQQRVS